MLKVLLAVSLVCSLSIAAMFQSVPPKEATLIQSGDEKSYCPNCGMNLPKFYKTNHTHNKHQYCSIHCLVEATKGKVPTDVNVVDTNSLKFINAKEAFYVVGSSKKGTMSAKSKYAFKSLKDAEVFKKSFGGEIMKFNLAYNIAKSDMHNDMKMISAKKEKMVYKKGAMMLKKLCHEDKIDVSKFATIAQLKASLAASTTCKANLKDKQLQAISVYLWDHKKCNGVHVEHIKVPNNAKCPICGMFVAKYPKWAAVTDDGVKKEYFDGVKDLMKFLQSNSKRVKTIKVTDYYTTSAIDAKSAFYVIGSNVYGPMGNELIPFSTKDAANDFVKNHGGKVVPFSKITKKMVTDLNE